MYAMQGLQPFEAIAIWAVFGVAILGLLYAVFLRNQIMREDKGTAKMQEVWGAIKDGADAYLRRQLRSILPLIAILTVALFFSVYIVPPSPEALAARVSGTMVVKCTITKKGLVENCRVIKGLPHMNEAVVQSLLARVFKPILLNGKAVAVDYVFNIRLVAPRRG